MTNHRVTLGLIQSRAVWIRSAPRRHRARIRLAAGGGARVICVQELFRSRYFPQAEDTAAFPWRNPFPARPPSFSAPSHGSWRW